MFRQKDIIELKDIPEEECDVCYLHEKAYEFFENKNLNDDQEFCPCCNEPMDNYACGYEGNVTVGGHNEYTEDENIGYYKVYECNKCNKVFAMIPQEIKYNANHDIFYTGGNRFLSKTDEDNLMSKIKEMMTETTKQFVDRVKDGETNLSELNLQYWNEGQLEHAISEFLYEKGLKI